MDDKKCERCGSELRVETVKVPVFKVTHSAGGGYQTKQEIDHYEDREDVSDCVRCTGSY